jgi:hypothetical protein
LLGTTSCHKPVAGNLGQPVVLPIHRAATFHKSDLDLYFRRVASDSRCPTGATCITAGDAVVTLEGRILKGPVESFDVRLPGGEAPDSVIWRLYEGYRIRLVSLEPRPIAGENPDTNRYVGTFVVQQH